MTDLQEPTARTASPEPRNGRVRSRIVRIGNSEVVARGLAPGRESLSHLAMTASWTVFIAGSAAAYFAINLVFALIYFAADLAGARPVANIGAFTDYLYFSFETFSTVGYGDMHPMTHFGHVLASVEMFAGLLSAAIITGLSVSRIMRPTARLLFAHSPVVTQFEGAPTLMIRIANERHNLISNAGARLWLIRDEVSAEGVELRRFHELVLVRERNPMFRLSWTVMHRIDATSPLNGATPASLSQPNVDLVLAVEGLDETTQMIVRARQTYSHKAIRFGERYADILDTDEEGRTVLDYGRFHDTEKAP